MNARATQQLMALWSHLGLAHADYTDDRHAFASYLLARHVESFKSLSAEENIRLRRFAKALLDIQEMRAPGLGGPDVLRSFCLWAMDHRQPIGTPKDVTAALDGFQHAHQSLPQ